MVRPRRSARSSVCGPCSKHRVIDPRLIVQAKRSGFSDRQLAHIWETTEEDMYELRRSAAVGPTFKTVDTCAAEFEAFTPYMYSTYEEEDEVPPPERPRVMVLGSGPNRIGQGIEFDYCCVHAAFALQGSRLRDDHGELQPRDRLHRLRHLRPSLFRAAHGRGRARGGEGGATRCGGGAVGRADPAQAGETPGVGRAQHRRHLARVDRHRRGPGALRRVVPRARGQAAAARDRSEPLPGRGGDRPDRLPRIGPALVRPRGAGDACRLQLRRAGRRPR